MQAYTYPKELQGIPLPIPKTKEKETSLQFKLVEWVKTGQFNLK